MNLLFVSVPEGARNYRKDGEYHKWDIHKEGEKLKTFLYHAGGNYILLGPAGEITEEQARELAAEKIYDYDGILREVYRDYSVNNIHPKWVTSEESFQSYCRAHNINDSDLVLKKQDI